MRIDKQFIEDAYRKLKGSVYLDKTVPFIRMRIVDFERGDVEEKIEYIQNILTTADKISFNNIIKDNTKDEVIATFLSLLELIKAKEIVVVQENFFEDIIIKKNLEN